MSRGTDRDGAASSGYGWGMRFAARARSVFAGAAVATAVGLALSGCPRQPDAPDPGTGQPCETLADCNPGVDCGLLRLCVEDFCEAEASLVRACDDVGAPVRPPDG